MCADHPSGASPGLVSWLLGGVAGWSLGGRGGVDCGGAMMRKSNGVRGARKEERERRGEIVGERGCDIVQERSGAVTTSPAAPSWAVACAFK